MQIAAASTLEAHLARFRHAVLGWPEGLRSGDGWATLEDVERMKSDVRDCLRLDVRSEDRDFLVAFKTQVNIMIGQLKSDQGLCFFGGCGG